MQRWWRHNIMSWQQVLDMIKDTRRRRLTEPQLGGNLRPPDSCPNDGHELEVVTPITRDAYSDYSVISPAGFGRSTAQRHCKFCGFIWP